MNENPIVENWRLRWRGTATVWRVVFVIAPVALLVSLMFGPTNHPGPVLGFMRTLAVALFVAANVANKVAADDLYTRIYAEASVLCVVVSLVALFGMSQLA